MIVPDAFHLPHQIMRVDLATRLIAAHGAARAMRARTKRQRAAATLDVVTLCAHRAWYDTGLAQGGGGRSLSMHP